MARRSTSIRAMNARRALGIFDPYACAADRVARLLERGFAVDSRRRPDGTFSHRPARVPRKPATARTEAQP